MHISRLLEIGKNIPRRNNTLKQRNLPKKIQNNLLSQKKENTMTLHRNPRKNLQKRPEKSVVLTKKIIKSPGPWVRFWARTLDLILLSFPAGFLFWFLFPEFTTRVTKAGGPFVIGFFILSFVVIIEAIIITIFGNTPAKAILKTKITNSEESLYLFLCLLHLQLYLSHGFQKGKR